MEERHNEAERGEALRSVIRAGRTSILARAATTVEAEPAGRTKGELYRTFGNGYTRAFELAVTPTLFGLMGYGLDRWLGIIPVLTLVFALTAFLSLLLSTWSGYVEQMKSLESAGPWARASTPAPAVPAAPAIPVVPAAPAVPAVPAAPAVPPPVSANEALA